MMAASDHASRIFVTSSNEDSEFGMRLVKNLRDVLDDEGAVYYVWQDGNVSERRETEEKLIASPIFIVIVSPDGLASPRVMALTNLALEQKAKKKILPVECRQCEGMPADLSAYQSVKFLAPMAYKAAFDKLFEEVLRTLGLATDKKIQKRKNKLLSRIREPIDPLIERTQQTIIQIKEAFGKEYWDTVKGKVGYLLKQNQTAMTPELYRMQGRALQEMGEIEAAQLAFGNANWMSEQGMVQANTNYFKAKQYKKVIAACDRVITADLEYAPAYNLKGLALNNLKVYTEALAACERAIQLDPNLAVAHNNKGDILYSLRQYSEALVAYEQALKLDPSLALARKGMLLTLKSVERSGNKSNLLTEQQKVQGNVQENSSTDLQTVNTSNTPDMSDVLWTLRKFRSGRRFYIAPTIPVDLLATARSRCNVPSGEQMVGFIDCTGLGSAKYSILFGTIGIYYCSKNARPEMGIILYSDFRNCVFRKQGPWMVDTGIGFKISIAGSAVSNQKISDLFDAIKQLTLEPDETYKLTQKQEVQIPSSGTEPSMADVLRILQKFPLGRKFYMYPVIPDDKLATARSLCNVPSNELVLGLIDCTVWGSAKRCILFGAMGIYFRYSFGSPGMGMIAYADFPDCAFTKQGPWYVVTDTGIRLNLSGSNVSTQQVCDILNIIKEFVIKQDNVQHVDIPSIPDNSESLSGIINASSPTSEQEEKAVPVSSISTPKQAISTGTPPIIGGTITIEQKNIEKKNIIIGCSLISLVFLLIFGCLGLLFYQTTAKRIATDNAYATATALIKAAQVQATAFAVATATIIAQNPDPYPPSSGTLVLYDPLNQPSNWNNESDSSFGGTCHFINGFYSISESQSPHLYPCLAPRSNFSNFAFEVQLKITKGDCGGMTFRQSQTALYGYVVCQDGAYSLYLVTASSNKSLRAIYAPAIHRGLNQSNTIAIVAHANTLDFYVNKQKIDSIQDDTSNQGIIGLLAADFNKPTEVVYSYAKVWTL